MGQGGEKSMRITSVSGRGTKIGARIKKLSSHRKSQFPTMYYTKQQYADFFFSHVMGTLKVKAVGNSNLVWVYILFVRFMSVCGAVCPHRQAYAFIIFVAPSQT